MGHDDESSTTILETARREATSTFRSRWDLKIAWGLAKLLQWAKVVEGAECGAETEDAAGSSC